MFSDMRTINLAHKLYLWSTNDTVLRRCLLCEPNVYIRGTGMWLCAAFYTRAQRMWGGLRQSMVYSECSSQLCPCHQRIQHHEWALGLEKFKTKHKIDPLVFHGDCMRSPLIIISAVLARFDSPCHIMYVEVKFVLKCSNSSSTRYTKGYCLSFDSSKPRDLNSGVFYHIYVALKWYFFLSSVNMIFFPLGSVLWSCKKKNRK
jgi:hypothetical protein